jgi:hypothetical protein
VPIVADIDAGFGNEEATYLLAKKNDWGWRLLHTNWESGLRC